MQAEASACVSELANVLFCAWAVHYIVFSFCRSLLLGSFFRLAGNVDNMASKGLRAISYQVIRKVEADYKPSHTP
ncbi:MAG: hypothetical protein GX587_08600 [Bacteroidales bacterium]|nr:hypothetical protein [Bacteroidales bacterium]